MNDDGGGFAGRLRRFRLSAGLSQEELAARSGMSVRAIGNLERGCSRWPYRSSLDRLADALELDDAVRAELVRAAGRRQIVGVPHSACRTADESRGGDGSQLVPRQLPAPVLGFTGRDGELALLTSLLARDETSAPEQMVISVISGFAGVGKTALAVHWAHQVAERFPDGQLYLNLRGFAPSGTPVTPVHTLRYILSGLAVPAERIPAELPAQAALFRGLLADKRMLILLDNARDAAQIEPLLPASGRSMVLVTSRSHLTGLAAIGATELTLDVLTESDAHELFARRLGADRVRADRAAAAELIERCARLPLALAVLAGRAATRPAFPLAALAAELRHEGDRLDALDAGDQDASVRAAFSWSQRQLSGPAARMFRLLGLHPGPDVTVPAAASLASFPLPRARRALAELARAHLLAERLPGRYSCHDLMRAYAAEQARAADSDAARRSAVVRLVDHYLHTAHAADRLLHPARRPIALAPARPGVTVDRFAGISQALAWFEAEHQVLLAVITLAAGNGLDAQTWQLAWTMETFWRRRAKGQEAANAQRIALAAAQRSGDLVAQAGAHRGAAATLTYIGHYTDAMGNFDRGLRLYGGIGDPAGQAGNVHQCRRLVPGQDGLLPRCASPLFLGR
jgi:transcriptional regulator with XRE-family HTH domain